MQFKRRLKTSVNPDLVPLIDIIFQLLIFFMVSTTFLQLPGIIIAEPESETAESVFLDRLNITVVSESEIFLNEKITTLSNLKRDLLAFKEKAEGSGAEPIKSIIITIPEDQTVGLETKVVDAITQTNFKNAVIARKVRLLGRE
ncbi:MAG: biopolymer transporter ExbD [Spirochaetales bacterium]|nr:biopolymer transporter ExbD [Spirochaetales bacterium]